MMDVMENIVVDHVDYEFRNAAGGSVLLFTLRLAQIFTCGLVLGTNVPMIIFIMKQGSRTFLDRLIVFDCFLCLGNLHVITILVRTGYDDIGFCTFQVYLSFFLNLCNKLLNLGIVIYRFILVFGSSHLVITHKRKLEFGIPLAIFLTSSSLTGWAISYREKYRHFLGKI